MKEKDLLKSVADKQMPDLEQIRQNILNQSPQKQKPKILTIKPSKLIAVAAVVALATVGTIAALANPNGVFSILNKPEEKVTQPVTATQPATKPTKAAEPKKKTKSKSASKSKESQKAKNERYVKQLNKNGFDATWLYSLGKVDGYRIVYAGNNNTASYSCDYIMGNYTFHTEKQQSPYGLGLYVCDKKKSYTLSYAYENGLFDDFSDAVSVISDYDDNDLGIEVRINNATSALFTDYFKGRDILTIAKISAKDNYELYFNIASDYTDKSDKKVVDGYTFYLDKVQTPYDLGLYVLSGDKLYTLEEAVENEIVEMDDIFEAVHSDSNVPYNFGLFEEEDDEDEEAIEETQEATAVDDEDSAEIEN